MLAAVRWGAVLLGLGAGALSATALSLALGAALDLLGAEQGPLAGLFAGVLLGLAAAGYVAGRLAPFSHRFHGAIAAMGLAALVVVIARLGGSPAPTPQVLLLAGLAILLGGAGGTFGGRRR